MAGILGEFFLVSVSHGTKREKSSKNSGKIRSKIWGKTRDKNSKNSFCNFPDLKIVIRNNDGSVTVSVKFREVKSK